MRTWLVLPLTFVLGSPLGCQQLPDTEPDDDGNPPPASTDGGTFLPQDTGDDMMDGDTGDPGTACNPVAQTGCAGGQKCTAIEVGGSVDYTCVSDPGGLGPSEPCTPNDDGIDGCPAGYACLSDASDNGLCLPLCLDDANCTQAQCIPSREEEIPYCADDCSPFESQCSSPLACRRNDIRFSCQFLTESDVGGAGEACNPNDDGGCAPGLVCLPGALVPECSTDNCCTSLCDLSEADPCTAPATCVQVLTGPAPGFEDIGACFVPA